MPQSSAESAVASGMAAAQVADARTAPRGERRALLALGAITLFGALLRAWRMNEVWLAADEAVYYVSTLGDWESANQRIQVNAHPPLYYWILFGLAKWAGSIEALRLTALVPGVLCIPAVYLLARSFAGRTAGLGAAFLVAVSPGGQFLSQVMRPYSVQLLFLILGLAGLARYLTTARVRWLVVHSACGLAATFVHYSSFIVHAGVATCLVGLWLLKQLDLRQVRALILAEVPVVVGMAWLYLTHIRPSLMGGQVQTNVRETWLSRGFLTSPTQLGTTLVDVLAFLFGRPADFALLAAIPIGLLVCARERLWTPFLLSVGTGAAAVLLSFLGQYPLLGQRHCLYLLALLAPLAGIALGGLASSPQRRWRWLGAVLAAVVAASLVHVPRVLDRRWRGAERGPTNATVEQVRAALESDALAGSVVLTDPGTGVLLACLYRDPRENYTKIAGGPVYFVDAGRRRFYCLRGGYRLIAERDRRDEANHLEQLLGGLERLAGDGHVPALDERVWIVQAGYGDQVQHVLPESLADGTFLRSPRIGSYWISIFQIDRAAYRRYLEE